MVQLLLDFAADQASQQGTETEHNDEQRAAFHHLEDDADYGYPVHRFYEVNAHRIVFIAAVEGVYFGEKQGVLTNS